AAAGYRATRTCRFSDDPTRRLGRRQIQNRLRPHHHPSRRYPTMKKILILLAIGLPLACGDGAGDEPQNDAEEVAEEVEEAVEDGAEATEEAAEDGAEAAEDGVESAGDAVEEAADEVEDETDD